MEEKLSMMKGDMTFKQVHWAWPWSWRGLSDINLTIPQGLQDDFVFRSGKTTQPRRQATCDPSHRLPVKPILIRLIKRPCVWQFICLNSPIWNAENLSLSQGGGRNLVRISYAAGIYRDSGGWCLRNCTYWMGSQATTNVMPLTTHLCSDIGLRHQ